MKITQDDMNAASEQEIISREQAQILWEFLEHNTGTHSRFNFTHLLYFLGGLIAISAMTLFMNLGWEKFGHSALIVLSALYISCSWGAAEICNRQHLRVPAALLGCFSITLIPLLTYSVMKLSGLWPESAGFPDYLEQHNIQHAQAWMTLEASVLLWGAFTLWRFRHPLLVLPLVLGSWFLLLDFTSMMSGALNGQQIRNTGISFGLLLFAGSILTDLFQPDDDFGLWPCMTGLCLFWLCLTLSNSGSELGKALYCFINLLLLLLGVILQRPIAIILGAAGLSFYLGHLAYDLFRDNWLFPLALSFVGLALLGCGILWHRKGQLIRQRCQQWLPAKLQQAINHRR